MKSRIAVGLLVLATISLTALCVYQQRVIDHQRELIIAFWKFVQAGCPGGPFTN